jgi:hypothetical protein
MSTSTLSSVDTMIEDNASYRAISKAAVASLVLAVISFLGLLFWPILVLAVLGFFLGVIGYRSIRRFPLELVGKTPAVLGAGLCAVLFVGGVSKHSYEYATEVPEGYKRITFANLQPVREHPELPVPPEALQLDGQRIFVKGYVYPDGQKTKIKKFILVPDMGTCCFGGQPKLTDMIEVTLADPIRIAYSQRKRKLGGILRVDTSLKPVAKVNGVFYQLEADHLQ